MNGYNLRVWETILPSLLEINSKGHSNVVCEVTWRRLVFWLNFGDRWTTTGDEVNLAPLIPPVNSCSPSFRVGSVDSPFPSPGPVFASSPTWPVRISVFVKPLNSVMISLAYEAAQDGDCTRRLIRASIGQFEIEFQQTMIDLWSISSPIDRNSTLLKIHLRLINQINSSIDLSRCQYCLRSAFLPLPLQ